MNETEKGQTFASIFENKKISVPAYQRAYAWEAKQIEPFIDDLREFQAYKENQESLKRYYFGHFILEKNSTGFELVDGQQRLTTFILFLIVCKYLAKENRNCIDEICKPCFENFSTVDYDQDGFLTIQNKLASTDGDWNAKYFFDQGKEVTESLLRIIATLNYFRKAFIVDKKLKTENIKDYIQILLEAHASVHTITDKSVAVQIFELHNTRGIKLNTIEKVKAKLMKAVYQHSKNSDADVETIQNYFAKIYALEEQTSASSFRGGLELDALLFNHLHVIDDGTKFDEKVNAESFNSPGRWGTLEDRILAYLDEQLTLGKKNKSPAAITTYALKVTQHFLNSVRIMCKHIPQWDTQESIVGDVLILDKTLSCEFFLIISNLFGSNVESEEPQFGRISINELLLWEQLLFTRDFHDRYHNLQWRDNFPSLFYEINKSKNKFSDKLKTFVNDGFRKDKIVHLPTAFKTFVEKNSTSIKTIAYTWWNHKMKYVLYKYEKSIGVNLYELRKIVKDGISLEHILPHNWQYDWVSEDNAKGVQIEKKIEPIIDGIGNLLILNKSQNSSLSDHHPVEKAEEYSKLGLGGSYAAQKSEDWGNADNWENIIKDRSEKIYEFLQKYFIECDKKFEIEKK